MEIAGYEIGEAILRDQHFAMHRGRRIGSGAPVLLKVPSGSGSTGRLPDALAREFALLRSLSIPGVPHAHDLVSSAEGPCLVLEDRGLRPLADLTARGPLDLPAVFRIGGQLCAILGDLHQLDVTHGSVTPHGILTTSEGADVQLLDFGSASRSAGAARPAATSASAAYLSPEQTGRINRTVDYRTDLYSLGATLYEMLTGSAPFRGDDLLELVHARIARMPTPPTALQAAVPEQVSRIVMKLLAKEAEDRYRSAHGARHDLDRCEREWRASGRIVTFDLAQEDVPDRFLVPQRLYGRDREVGQLLKAFEATGDGRASLLLVSGYPGIGKTSLINELYKPLVRRRGYFISGKFDQVVRNIPYGAIIQAFRGLVQQLLTESEERLAAWRARLLGALGANGGVVAEVIPEVELILGRQPPPPTLEPAEAQNRFRYVFRAFVGVFAGREHPLVVFLDDLQWVDAATLDLLHALLTDSELGHLLVVCAYRDSEIDGEHRLTWALDRLEAAHAPVHRLVLAPLRLEDLVPFLCDTLHGNPGEVMPLAQLVRQKTDGNPFFVIQFLKTLHQDGFFSLDRARACWTFRIDAIARAGITDNVIDLMTRKISRLSAASQDMLRLAACIGNRFAWNTFLTVSRQKPEEAAAGLAEALDAGLVQPAGGPCDAAESGPSGSSAFEFLHDRVQQAAYDAIPDARRKPVHLDVGRLMLAQYGPDPSDDRIFEMVNHLNIGSDLITDTAERTALVRLNLAAGRKAKQSAAFRAASDYLDAGIKLLAADDWQADYPLAFALHLEAAECRYLAGAFEQAERDLDDLLGRARTPLDRARVDGLRITLYENLSRWTEAVASGREGLAPFGIVFPDGPDAKQAALDGEVEAIRLAVGGRPIASLLDLPVMTDATVRMAMRLLTILWAPAYILGDQLLARLISATLVRLSLVHGNTEDSAYGYVTHAITVGPIRRDYEAAHEWGLLALRVNERFHDAKSRAKIHQQFQAHVNLWRRPFATCVPYAREACRSGLETGDFTYAGYGAATEGWAALLVARDLDRFVRDYTPHLALLARIQMSDFRAAHQVVLNWARALQGRTAGPLSLSDATFDEREFVAKYERAAPFFLTFLYTARLHLAVMFGAFETALEAARCARAAAVVGTIWPVLIDFWEGLAMTALYDGATDRTRAEYQERLAVTLASLAELSDHCPENFRGFWLLLSAEMARVTGRVSSAAQMLDDAAGYARQTGSLDQEALAYELCARLWRGRGYEAVGAAFLREARRCYADWGAASKVRHLDEAGGQGPGMAEASAGSATEAVTEPGGKPDFPSLDLATVLKMARAVGSEIELDGLLRTLITLAVENAGAERGLFFEQRDGLLHVEAEARAAPQQVAVRQTVSLERATGVAQSVVRFVQRTREPVVLGDASSDERFAGDPNIAGNRVRSILCVPVGHQGRLGGVLYLENNLTTEAFTPDRLEMMRALAAQAAISLENARLYEAMRTEIARRTQAEQALRGALAELEGLKNRLEVENVYLQEEIRTQHNFNEIVGNSPALVEALRRIERVAPTESTVLIVGETGSGKELFARAVHNRSRRRNRPLVKVNCGAIAPGLVESELFGHAKGAFTGAIDKRIGRFEVADGGTIFLDEVGELPLDAQVKLLRVLQEQEFEPVGSSRTVRVDIRVIAATNRDLDQAVREGRFRADLLYRLNVFPVHVPSLRERAADIPLLAGFFAAGLARKLGKPVQGFSSRSMAWLTGYSWPGNVRELQNIVERAAILAHGPVLEVEGALPETVKAPPVATEEPEGKGGRTLDDVQRLHILNVLNATDGVVEGARGAARRLGLHPNTLRSRMKKLGIRPRSSRTS